MVGVLSALAAPYMLADGSLLQFYRNCTTGNSDVDFAIQVKWWQDNQKRLQQELIKKGFKREKTFGDINQQWGYAESWKKFGVKADLYGNILVDGYSIVPLWIGKNVFSCHMKVERIVYYQWLEGLVVRGPFPIEDALMSAYGFNYRHPIEKWSWDRDAFVTGYCRFEERHRSVSSN